MRIQRTYPYYARTDDRWIVDLVGRCDLLDGLVGVERRAGRRELVGVELAGRPGCLPLAATSRAWVARSRMNTRSMCANRASSATAGSAIGESLVVPIGIGSFSVLDPDALLTQVVHPTTDTTSPC